MEIDGSVVHDTPPLCPPPFWNESTPAISPRTPATRRRRCRSRSHIPLSLGRLRLLPAVVIAVGLALPLKAPGPPAGPARAGPTLTEIVVPVLRESAQPGVLVVLKGELPAD